MGCPKIAYNLYSKPAMRCVYNSADRVESCACERKGTFRTGMIAEKKTFYYDDLDRLTQVQHNNNVIKTIIYAGDYEEITDENNVTQKIIYLPGGGLHITQGNQSIIVITIHFPYIRTLLLNKI